MTECGICIPSTDEIFKNACNSQKTLLHVETLESAPAQGAQCRPCCQAPRSCVRGINKARVMSHTGSGNEEPPPLCSGANFLYRRSLLARFPNLPHHQPPVRFLSVALRIGGNGAPLGSLTDRDKMMPLLGGFCPKQQWDGVLAQSR